MAVAYVVHHFLRFYLANFFPYSRFHFPRDIIAMGFLGTGSGMLGFGLNTYMRGGCFLAVVGGWGGCLLAISVVVPSSFQIYDFLMLIWGIFSPAYPGKEAFQLTSVLLIEACMAKVAVVEPMNAKTFAVGRNQSDIMTKRRTPSELRVCTLQ